jgi:hypothetical protein
LLNPSCCPLLPLADILRLEQATILLNQSTITPLDTGATGICERAAGPEGTPHRNFIPKFALVIGSTALLATVLHGIESAIWAAAYRVLGALPDNRFATLYSLSAMTTHGHLNRYLKDQWQLMGALEALNGMLLFGLRTAFLFAMIQRICRSVVGNGIQNLSCAILATENSYGVSYPLESQAREDCLFFPALGIPVAFSDAFLRAFVRSIGGKRAFSLPSAIGPK